MATPKPDRDHATQEDLAAHLGINPATLSRWKKMDGFREAVIDVAEDLLRDDLPEIYGALSREAKNGSYQHIRLALEVTGRYSTTGTPDNPVHTVTESREEWERRAAARAAAAGATLAEFDEPEPDGTE